MEKMQARDDKGRKVEMASDAQVVGATANGDLGINTEEVQFSS